MKDLIFIILSIVILLCFQVASCQLKKKAIKSNSENKESSTEVKIVFEILSDQISLDEIKKIDAFDKKIIAYSNFEILATLKQINRTEDTIKVDNFITYENFEITNIKKEDKDDLITFYDYQIVFDPETYETYGISDEVLKPNEYSLDTINLVNDFKFYLNEPDTFLIRIKKQYFEKEIYSNWDTLILN